MDNNHNWEKILDINSQLWLFWIMIPVVILGPQMVGYKNNQQRLVVFGGPKIDSLDGLLPNTAPGKTGRNQNSNDLSVQGGAPVR